MASDPHRIYHEHNKVKIFVKIILALVAVFIVFVIFLFIFFQRFIVFTPTGLKLDIHGYYAESDTDSEESPPPSVDIIWH